MAKRSNPLDILSPVEEQSEEVKTAPVNQPDNEILPEKKGRPIDLLEASANIILSQLPSSTRDFVIEVADIVLKIPRWELVAGSILAQYSQGTLASPDLDPSWRDPVIAKIVSVCAYHDCVKEFVPKRRGQQFCSNECGGKQRKEELEKKLAEEAETLRRKMIAYIEHMKDEVIKQGGKPTQIVLAANVYRQIGPVLQDRNVVLGLKIKVDEGAPDDRIYITNT